MPTKVSSSFRKDRIEALADGIFATVMTILVLSLVVPTITGSVVSTTLEADLYGLLPDLFAYVITFIFLGILWIGHQSSLSHITRIDLRILWVNILLLLGVGLIPFSTALLGRYPQQPLANIAYGINGLAVTILYTVLFFYPRFQHLTHEEPEPRTTVYRSIVVIIGPIVYALAIVLALISTDLCLALYASVTIFYIAFGGRFTH
jgi:uncharacterized membrane protein